MKNKELFEDLYYSYLSKKKELCNEILKNDNRISEIDKFLSEVEDKDRDLKIFSPFDIDSVYEGRIQNEKETKESLKKSNDDMLSLVKHLDKRISQFKELLDDEEKESEKIDNSENMEFEVSVLNIQEKERSRIATELHDTTVQNLVHLIHSLELCSKFIDQDPIRVKLEIESCSKNLKSTINEIRETIFNLKPMSFADLGFVKCINDFMNNMMVQYPAVQFEFEVDEIGDSPDINISTFRIIQECVLNSLKHSQSSDLVLHVKHIDSNCEISVIDHGIGFDPESISDNHFGLSIVKERVVLLKGSINIDSKPGVGTVIHIIIPLV